MEQEILLAYQILNVVQFFYENFVAIEMNRVKIMFDKPIYVGQAILDISKLTLFDFHYNFMMKEIPLEKCKLLYTDTDSLTYEILDNDMYRLSKEHAHKSFDASDYPPDNVYVYVKITFDDYVRCLHEGVKVLCTQNMMRSPKHQIYGERQVKIALSREDDKRYIREDGISTLLWGHCSLFE